MTEVHLRIDELVLHGFDARQRYVIADALQVELARLLAASVGEHGRPPLPSEDRDHRRVDAGSCALVPDTTAATTGVQLAAAVHAAIEPLLSWEPGRG